MLIYYNAAALLFKSGPHILDRPWIVPQIFKLLPIVIAAMITSIFIGQLLRAHVKLLHDHVNVIACARKAIA